MREVTWRMFIDDLIDTVNKMQGDLDQIKQDMQDFRQDTTDIIDMQYDMDKKLNQTLSILKDVVEDD
jgi:hypothetical protein